MSLDQRGTPRSADLGPSQAGHLETAAIVFVVLAAMLLFIWLIWLAITRSTEWISSLQSKTPPQQQTQAEQQTPPQQQTPPSNRRRLSNSLRLNNNVDRSLSDGPTRMCLS